MDHIRDGLTFERLKNAVLIKRLQEDVVPNFEMTMSLAIKNGLLDINDPVKTRAFLERIVIELLQDAASRFDEHESRMIRDNVSANQSLVKCTNRLNSSTAIFEESMKKKTASLRDEVKVAQNKEYDFRNTVNKITQALNIVLPMDDVDLKDKDDIVKNFMEKNRTFITGLIQKLNDSGGIVGRQSLVPQLVLDATNDGIEVVRIDGVGDGAVADQSCTIPPDLDVSDIVDAYDDGIVVAESSMPSDLDLSNIVTVYETAGNDDGSVSDRSSSIARDLDVPEFITFGERKPVVTNTEPPVKNTKTKSFVNKSCKWVKKPSRVRRHRWESLLAAKAEQRKPPDTAEEQFAALLEAAKCNDALTASVRK